MRRQRHTDNDHGALRSRRGAATLAMAWVLAWLVAGAACAPTSMQRESPGPAPIEPDCATPEPRTATSVPPARPPSPTRQEPDRFLYRFNVIPGQGDGAGLFEVIARPLDDGLVALVGFDGTLSIDGRVIDGGYHDFAIVRIDSQGDVRWVWSDGASPESRADQGGRYGNALCVDPSGASLVGGVFQRRGHGFSVASLDPQGGELWRVEPTRGSAWSEVHDLTRSSSGRVVAVGHYAESLRLPGFESLRCGHSCGFVVGLDGQDGSIEWLRGLETPEGALVATASLEDGDVLVAGHFRRFAVMGERRVRGDRLDLLIARLSLDGELRWLTTVGRRGHDDELRAMEILAGGRAALMVQGMVFVVDLSNGRLLWRQELNRDDELIHSSPPRRALWILRKVVSPLGITRLQLLALSGDGGDPQPVGELRTATFRLEGRLHPVIGRHALLLGGSLRDNRWDALPAAPFLARIPLAEVAGGVALEGITRRGRPSVGRCSAEPRRWPERLDHLEIRTGLELLQPLLARCGGVARGLSIALRVSPRGLVTDAEVLDDVPAEQRQCLTEALRHARFCPFRGQPYRFETLIP